MTVRTTPFYLVARLTVLPRVRRYSTPSPSLIRNETFPCAHTGHVRVLYLNRPEARNAISRNLLSALKSAISSVDCAPTQTRALIITSDVPDIFCAGADLKERATFTLPETRAFLEDLNRTFGSISKLSIPTISAINGAALGGGLELALNTTFRITHEKAKLGLPETRLGIIPGAGGTYNLPRIIGYQKAMNLILTGRIITGQEARDVGLVDGLAVVGDAGNGKRETLELALQLAHGICEGGPIAVQQALQAVRGSSPTAESDAYEIVLNTEDRISALKAFAQKKKVQFVGR